MERPNNRILERVRYWQGQLLASDDLQTQLRVDEELRRRHNRSAHRAYGIAIGLGWASDKQAKVKNGEVTLLCGLAYDCAGRALLVTEDRTIQLPKTVIAGLTLVLSYDASSPDGIALTWTSKRDVNPNTGVPILRLSLDSGNPEIDQTFRPVVARPMARPQLATGITVPGGTAWQTWKIDKDEIGVQVLVDTTAAGFTRTPHYFAEAVPGRVTPDFVPAWFASIADPLPDSFKLQLLMRRITRETLDIADPKAQVSAAPVLDQQVTLDAGDRIVTGDLIARVLPLGERASTIKTLASGTATLDLPLDEFDGTKMVAFGNIPRVGKVTKIFDVASFFEVTVDTPENFAEGDVVINLSVSPAQTQPAQIGAVDIDSGALELLSAIGGLQPNHQLGVARDTDTVKSASADGLSVEVLDPAKFAVGNVVVRLGEAVNTTAPARITSIGGAMLKLESPLLNLEGGVSHLGLAQVSGRVLVVTNNVKENKIEVDDPNHFRAGDVVAKAGNPPSSPVRIQKISQNGTLSLSQPISGLALNDTIVAAEFRVRATVLQVLGKILKVADPSLFPLQSYVTGISGLLKATDPPQRVMSSSDALTLDEPLQKVKQGDVIGLCRFPPTVKVQSRQSGGKVSVDAAGLQESDLVMLVPATPQTGRPQLFVVAEAQGNLVRLAGFVPEVGDRLALANTRGVVNVTATANDTKVTIEQPNNAPRVRHGDFLAEITGWIQPMNNKSAMAVVTNVAGNKISLSSHIDGLLLNDTIGLTSLIPTRMQIRLNEAAVLSPGDQVLLLGTDRRRGESQSLFAVVTRPPAGKLVLLAPEGAFDPFEFRPEDVFASVLFVSGSPMRLIQQLDLFVSWLACGDSDAMPKSCSGMSSPVDVCSQSKESIV